MEYNEVIKMLREDKGLNQTQMGKLLNLSQRTISQYETKGRSMPIDILARYAKCFEVSADYILGLSKDPQKSWLEK